MADIKVRVGQQNAIKVVSSVSGSAGGYATIAENIIGGIASVTALSVSGVSTFVGISSFKDDVYIDGTLYGNNVSFDEFVANDLIVLGTGTISLLNAPIGIVTNLISGVSTIGSLYSNYGSITNINSSGISTLGFTSVSQLYVSGISTFVGISTFKNDVYIDGDLYVSDDLVFDEFISLNANIAGIATIGILYADSGTITNFNSTGISNLESAAISQLYITDISTFIGVSTFKNDVYIDGDLYANNNVFFDAFTVNNANVTGILTVANNFYYGSYSSNGVAYFDSSGLMVSTESTNNSIDYTNYILTTDNSGTPIWSSIIDGGSY
jgi:hypothetical protein